MGMVEMFLEMVGESSNIVFFGGAGVSTESGIPDYRGGDGIYSLIPEEMLSHSYLVQHPKEFFDFYRGNLMHPLAKPNIAHIKLASLEKAGKLLAVVTQNVDGLHQMAGSRSVDELHGNVHSNYCSECGKVYGFDYVYKFDGVPICASCGGMVRPNVVLFGEKLDQAVITDAANHISKADMLIIGGTSLAVYPAASLISLYKGDRIAVINKQPLGLNGAAVEISDSIGEVFKLIDI